MDAAHVLLCLAIFVIALLYSSVGHGGASGYIAVMSLFGLAASVIRPTALVLNIMVASLATWQFFRAGHFSWKLLWPFALTAIPFAYLGGNTQLSAGLFKILVGVVLILSALRFFWNPRERERRAPSVALSLAIGAILGLLSGLTGTGGGIFLTPLLLIMGWAGAKGAAAVSAPFILVNSVSGLAGTLRGGSFPQVPVSLVVAALAGGALGSQLGSTHLTPSVVKRLLAVVLLIAGVKLLTVG